jgi:hypothetical protein
MKICRNSTAFVVLVMSTTSLHANTASGVIHFTGLVYQAASASKAFHTTATQQARTVQTYSLDKAQAMLHSDVLDYYASYAPKDAAVVSSTYQ